MESYNWYCACDRSQAELILNRIKITTDSMFLVRPRHEGGYAITIKYKSTGSLYRIDHICVHMLEFKTPNGIAETNVCINELNQFPSIELLVNYYMNKSLGDVFIKIKTTLGLPYRVLLPVAICEATAMFDFDPNNSKTANTGVEIELKKGEKYWIIKKEPIGWWKVYNSNGLIGYVPGNYLSQEK